MLEISVLNLYFENYSKKEIEKANLQEYYLHYFKDNEEFVIKLNLSYGKEVTIWIPTKIFNSFNYNEKEKELVLIVKSDTNIQLVESYSDNKYCSLHVIQD